MFLWWDLQSIIPDISSCQGRKRELLLHAVSLHTQHPLLDDPALKLLGIQWRLYKNKHKSVYYSSHFRPNCWAAGGTSDGSRCCTLFPEPWALPPWLSNGVSGGPVCISKASQLQPDYPSLYQMCFSGIKWTFFFFPNKTLSASDTGMGFWQLTLFYQVIYHQSNTIRIVYYTSTDEILHKCINQVMLFLWSFWPNISYPAEAFSQILSFSCFI